MITKELLQNKLAGIETDQKQLVATINALDGAKQMIIQLLGEFDKLPANVKVIGEMTPEQLKEAIEQGVPA